MSTPTITPETLETLGARVGRAIARDVIAEDMPRAWTGLDAQDGDQFLAAGLVADSPEWTAAETAARAAYLVAIETVR